MTFALLRREGGTQNPAKGRELRCYGRTKFPNIEQASFVESPSPVKSTRLDRVRASERNRQTDLRSGPHHSSLLSQHEYRVGQGCAN